MDVARDQKARRVAAERTALPPILLETASDGYGETRPDHRLVSVSREIHPPYPVSRYDDMGGACDVEGRNRRSGGFTATSEREPLFATAGSGR